MKHVIALACIALAVSTAPAAVSIDWVTVGNAGNAADPLNSGTVPGIGAVSYAYRISKYEVTNAQYAEFLNAVAVSDPYGLYNTNMNSNAVGGITRSGTSGSYTYAVKTNMGNKPVNYVSWYDAARFTNWLTNGQGSGSTETGAYTLTSVSTLSAITRDLSDPDQVFLPTENEWYKAAYHQPAAQGGDSDDYWLYPTRSNSMPTAATATATGDIANPGTNVVNYNLEADWNSQDGNVTTSGSAGPNSRSYYGTADQGGNVWEWNETLIGAQRGIRGASWFSPEFSLRSENRGSGTPTSENDNRVGFRVAAPIPEPASAALLALGAGIALVRRRRLTR